MKNLLLILTLFSTFSFAQEISLKEKSGIYPLYIVDGIISNLPQMKLIHSTEITSVSIYKSDNLPENLGDFTNFSTEGIIDISLKTKIEKNETVSLSSLNIHNKLDEINPVYINSILLKDTKVKIVKDAIIDTEVIENNGQKFLNIWTISQDERNGVTKRTGAIKRNQKDRNTMKSVILQ